jgi:mannose-1-phosphate guanylyltransferase
MNRSPGNESRNLWSIILAGGEGMRLRSLTRALHGEELPKQYAHIVGEQSLLQRTVARALSWSPPEQIVVIVASDREARARSQLAAFGALQLIPQPRNRGTGPGILLPLSAVIAHDPDAIAVVLPSDHFVREEEPFRETIAASERRARENGSVVLVGAVPDSPDPQYGWIVPRRDASGRLYVDCFEEKPSPSVAQRLLDKGALWNTFVLVGPAKRLWEMGAAHLPEQARALGIFRQSGMVQKRELVWHTYEGLPPGDFSRDVLERAEGLEVMPLPECGWSDWGTPERVLASLRGTPEFGRLRQCLRSQPAAV